MTNKSNAPAGCCPARGCGFSCVKSCCYQNCSSSEKERQLPEMLERLEMLEDLELLERLETIEMIEKLERLGTHERLQRFERFEEAFSEVKKRHGLNLLQAHTKIPDDPGLNALLDLLDIAGMDNKELKQWEDYHDE